MENYFSYKRDGEFLRLRKEAMEQTQEDIKKWLRKEGLNSTIRAAIMNKIREADDAKYDYLEIREQQKEREATLLSRERNVFERESEMAIREASVAEREAHVTTREEKVNDREAKLDEDPIVIGA